MAAGGGFWDLAAGLREDTWGRRGRRRKKGERACSSWGSPCQPRGSRNLTGQSQTPHRLRGKNEPTFPSQPPALERVGGEQRRSGLESKPFRSCFMCDSLAPFRLSVWGDVGSCMRENAPARCPAPLLDPHFPNPGDLHAGLWCSGTQAARGRSPSPNPRAEVGQVLRKGQCRGSLPPLASAGRPTLRGDLRDCKTPGPPSKSIPWPGCVEASGGGRGQDGGLGGDGSEGPEGRMRKKETKSL